jgi:hypothetical protein
MANKNRRRLVGQRRGLIRNWGFARAWPARQTGRHWLAPGLLELARERPEQEQESLEQKALPAQQTGHHWQKAERALVLLELVPRGRELARQTDRLRPGREQVLAPREQE